MKSKLLSLILTVLACLTAIPSRAALEPVGTNVVDLGTIFCCDKRESKFEIVNKGSRDVTVKDIVSTCVCIVGKQDRDIIKPGEKLTLTTYLNPRSIDGEFTRSVWLETDDPETPRVLLSVSGVVKRLFTGVPKEPVVIQTADESLVITNRFTLKRTNPQYSLGEPASHIPGIKIVSTLETDKADPDTSHLTVIIHPRDFVRLRGRIRIPISGPKEVEPIEIDYAFYFGMQLNIIPNRVIVVNSGDALAKKVSVRISNGEIDPEKLGYEPMIDGIEISKEIEAPRAPSPFQALSAKTGTASVHPSANRISCTLNIAPDALAKLLAMDEPAITFTYPGHKKTKLPLSGITPLQ